MALTTPALSKSIAQPSKGQHPPEQALFKASLKAFELTPRAQVSYALSATIVESLAPRFAYGRRRSFKRYRITTIADHVHDYIHSDKWIDAKPFVAKPDSERQRKRALRLAEYRKRDANERYLNTQTLKSRGLSREHIMAQTKCGRSTYYQALKYRPASHTGIRKAPEEGKEDIQIKEDRLTEDSSTSLREETSLPECTREARVRDASEKGCNRDTLSSATGAESPISAIQARTAHLGRKPRGYYR